MDFKETGQDLLHIPFGELISNVANGIAEAQFKLDQSSMIVAELMSGQKVVRDINGNPVEETIDGQKTIKQIDSRVYFGKDKLSMIELGFVPNFYHFVDTVIDLKVAIRITKSENNQYKVYSTPVDGHYASSYNYDLNLSASVKIKLVPVPPPTMLEDRIKGSLLSISSDDDDQQSPTILTTKQPGK